MNGTKGDLLKSFIEIFFPRSITKLINLLGKHTFSLKERIFLSLFLSSMCSGCCQHILIKRNCLTACLHTIKYLLHSRSVNKYKLGWTSLIRLVWVFKFLLSSCKESILIVKVLGGIKRNLNHGNLNKNERSKMG